VAIEKDVVHTFQWIESELGGADIIVNNAGYLCNIPLPGWDVINGQKNKIFFFNAKIGPDLLL